MIGIFDSGVGGMTVARAIEQHCPGFPLIYLGDLARTPYGSKSPDTIIDYSRRNTEFLLKQGAKLIVIACNSAASTAAASLRSHFQEMIIGVIQPAVNKAATVSRNGRIGVIGTSATINSGVYERRLLALLPEARIHSQACPLLVPLVEEGWLVRRETKMIVKKYLHPLRDKQIDTLILGCTHYPLLKKVISPRIGRRVHIIDSSIEVALHLRQILDTDARLRETLYDPEAPSRFYVSDAPTPVYSLAGRIFGRSVHLEKTDV
jgi:glutamate racemase